MSARSPKQLRRGSGQVIRPARFQNSDKFSAGGPLLGLFGAGQPAYTPRQYDRLADEAYAKNVIAYLCVKLIADGIASLRFDLFRGEQELEAHPLLDLLSWQNPVTHGPRWWRELASYLLLAGNAYVEAVTPDELGLQSPKELWNLRPDRMKVVPGKMGVPEFYRYELNGQHVDFPIDPVDGTSRLLHLKDFHPLNDWYGFGPVEAAARWIDVDNAAGDLNLSLLQGGAMPAALAVFKEKMTDAQQRRAETQIRQLMANAANRVLVVGGDWDVKTLSQSLADMQWSEGLAESGRRICAGWNVPHILVIPGESTFNNREQARLELWEHTILPFVDMMLGDVMPWLRRLFGDPQLELRVDKLEVPALEVRRQTARKETREDYKAGLITLNEARAENFYDEVPEGGDEFFKPPAIVQIGAEAAARGDPTKPPPGDPGETPKPKPANEGGRPGNGKSPFDDPTTDKAADGLPARLPLEYRALIAALDQDVLIEETRPALLAIVRHFGQRTLNEVSERQASEKILLRIVFNIGQPLVTAFLASYAGQRIRGLIDETTRQAVAKALVQVYDEGATFPKLVRAIMGVFEDASNRRAEVIARTETTRATGAGTQAALVQGDVKWRGWLSSRDFSVRPDHVTLDGQVQPTDKPFTIHGYTAMHPGDFGVPNEDIGCRCIELALPDQQAIDEFASTAKRDQQWHDREAEMAQLEADLRELFRRGFERQGQKLTAVLNERFR